MVVDLTPTTANIVRSEAEGVRVVNAPIRQEKATVSDRHRIDLEISLKDDLASFITVEQKRNEELNII